MGTNDIEIALEPKYPVYVQKKCTKFSAEPIFTIRVFIMRIFLHHGSLVGLTGVFYLAKLECVYCNILSW